MAKTQNNRHQSHVSAGVAGIYDEVVKPGPCISLKDMPKEKQAELLKLYANRFSAPKIGLKPKNEKPRGFKRKFAKLYRVI